MPFHNSINHHPLTPRPSCLQMLLVLALYTACVVVAVACWCYVSLTDPAQPVRVCVDGIDGSGGIDHRISLPASSFVVWVIVQGGIGCWCMKQTQGHSRYCASCRKSVPGLDHHCLWCVRRGPLQLVQGAIAHGTISLTVAFPSLLLLGRLNTCIGTRNYFYFFVLAVTGK